jgi:hypothetical protein
VTFHRIYLILEFATGELYKEMKNQPNGRFQEAMAAKYVRQVLGTIKLFF